MNNSIESIVITGLGITVPQGQGKQAVSESLLKGSTCFSVMSKNGRQKESTFIGSEIQELNASGVKSCNALERVSYSLKVAAVTLNEAWDDANLSVIAPERIGLIAGGSNFQQRELVLRQEQYRDKPYYMRPNYGFNFMDGDLIGFCSQQFNIQGIGYTLGGASASGTLALIKAVQAVASGEVDVCICLGTLMDLSYFELYGLQALGAMGCVDGHCADQLCRPFDKNRRGFVYSEGCAAIVVESRKHALSRTAVPYAEVSGWSYHIDGHRNPDPQLEGEIRVIGNAIKNSGLSPNEIDYINPHATGSILGDEVEIKALAASNLRHAYINTTKSILGHSLSAAGTVEVVSTLLQMRSGRLHPSKNLDDPIDDDFNWVRTQAIVHDIKHALCLSFGFGGINTAICLHSKVS